MARNGERTESVPSQRVLNRLGVSGFIHRIPKSHGHAISMELNMPTVEPVEPKLSHPFGKNQKEYRTLKPIEFHMLLYTVGVDL